VNLGRGLDHARRRPRRRAGVLAAILLFTLGILGMATGALAKQHKPAKHKPAAHHKPTRHKPGKHKKRKHPKHAHWIVLNHPIDPAQEEDIPFGSQSQWLQPWRGYLTTPPASGIADGLGINFNVTRRADDVTAAALEAAGFRLARIEIPWDALDPANPSQLAPVNAATVRQELTSLVSHHIRPLILLNANSAEPTPKAPVTLHVITPALANSRQVVLDAASAAAVVPGRTGFNTLNGSGVAAGLLITSLKGTVATLSQPLKSGVQPGNYPGFTLAYAPFTDPSTSLPALNASFNTTLQGWLAYVQTVGNFVRSVVGGDNFDLEVWNELTFGSEFLNINQYYSPPVDPLAPPVAADGNTLRAILSATATEVQQLFPGVGIGDGFSDQEPYTSGVTVPPGVNIDKHYYEGTATYPAANVNDGTRPVDWFGRNFGTVTQGPGGFIWSDFWVPSYTSDFPEYWLTGLKTENLVRDITPLSESIGGVAHGRYTHPPGAAPPQVWMTETNLGHPASMTTDQAQQFQAKVALRYLLSYINKGLGRVYFYAVTGGNLSLASQTFVDAANQGQSSDPGLTFAALGRLTKYIHAASQMQPRSINLLQISTTDQRNVFNGFGQFPPLRNLDVTAFLPFQESSHQFLFAAYVMTRDLARVWQPPGPNEFDMPPAPYRFKIGNVNGCHMKLQGYDPLTGNAVNVKVISCSKHRLTFQTNLTDSPVLIQATEGKAPSRRGKAPSRKGKAPSRHGRAPSRHKG
jgi:hypothetical protein